MGGTASPGPLSGEGDKHRPGLVPPQRGQTRPVCRDPCFGQAALSVPISSHWMGLDGKNQHRAVPAGVMWEEGNPKIGLFMLFYPDSPFSPGHHSGDIKRDPQC